MKAAELRKLIGKRVEWIEAWCPHRGQGFRIEATLLEVKGKNLLVDRDGSADWKWLPHMRELRKVDA